MPWTDVPWIALYLFTLPDYRLNLPHPLRENVFNFIDLVAFASGFFDLMWCEQATFIDFMIHFEMNNISQNCFGICKESSNQSRLFVASTKSYFRENIQSLSGHARNCLFGLPYKDRNPWFVRMKVSICSETSSTVLRLRNSFLQQLFSRTLKSKNSHKCLRKSTARQGNWILRFELIWDRVHFCCWDDKRWHIFRSALCRCHRKQ